MGHTAKARYLGGHPAATDATKNCVVTLDDDAIRVENPTLRIPYNSIIGASMMSPRKDRARDFRFSPTAGLFGGMKENQSTVEANRFLGQMERETQITIRDEYGDTHAIRFGKLEMQGRDRKQKRADMRDEDYRGGDRFIREILAARYRARDAARDPASSDATPTTDPAGPSGNENPA
jgi:hypothetical protein